MLTILLKLVKIYNFHTFDSLGDHACDKKDPKVQPYEEKSLKLVQLLFAACNGDRLALERAYLSGLDMNMGDYDNRTALHLACAENHAACVKFLIDVCKVELDLQDRWGSTPMQEALRLNRSRIVAMLKKAMVMRGCTKESSISEEPENNKAIDRVNKADNHDRAQVEILINGHGPDDTADKEDIANKPDVLVT